MKKKSIILAFTLLGLCSCSFSETFSWGNYINMSKAMGLKSEKLSSVKVFTDFSAIENRKSNLKSIINNKGNVNSFNRAYNLVFDDYVSIVNNYIFSEVFYYENPSTANENAYESCYEEYAETYRFLCDIEEDIANSSQEIKVSYFGNISDEEIAKIVEESKKSSESVDIANELKEIEDDGVQLMNSLRNKEITVEQYINTTYDYFYEYIQKSQEIADKYEYDNYLEYSYENDFSRDYTTDDAANFCAYVKQYLAPILAQKKKVQLSSDEYDKNFVTTLSDYNICNATTMAFKLLDSYADSMGSNYKKAYDHLWNDGYYCFANKSNSLGTAFIVSTYDNYFYPDESIAYFAADYQTILNVVHEFGHYYSNYSNSNALNFSMDIKETFSQGDEFTFLNFLKTNYLGDNVNAKNYQFYIDSNVYGNLFYIVQEAIITEIEKFAFSDSTRSKEDMIDGINAILNSYGDAADEDYWCYAVVASSGYYISYATSSIESLQFFQMPYNDAKTTYKSFVENSKSSNNMLTTWTSAGLSSPFEESTFSALANTFQEISDRY